MFYFPLNFKSDWTQLTRSFMEPIVRRKIPTCVRSLLTSISPKDTQNVSDWTETNQESLNEDEIKRAGTAETFLSPADDTEPSIPAERATKACGLCFSRPSCYTCPRCNTPYCGLACYRGPDHSACSEQFYKESVFQELKSQGVTDEEGKSKMQEILLRLRQSADMEGGMESFVRNRADDTGLSEQDGRALELLTRLAEIQSSGEEKSSDVQDILTQLRGLDEEIVDCDEEEPDLAEKMAGMDIDALSEEQLWSLFSDKEKTKFMSLLSGGGIGGLVPLWSPWWEHHEETSKAKVEVLQTEKDKESQAGDNKAEEPKIKNGRCKKSSVPPLSTKIPALIKLTSNPSPLVQNSLVNALYGYTFSLSLFNGDVSEPDILMEFCQAVLSISEALQGRRVFNSVSEALQAGLTAVSSNRCYYPEDPSAPLRAVEAVAHVLTGEHPQNVAGYSLAALSQLRVCLNQARASVPKEEEQTRRIYFQAGKKCEFFQAWVKENPKGVCGLSGRVWKEYEKMMIGKMGLEEEKKYVEPIRKKCSRKVLIQELE